jgi:hypothetical protein
MPAKSYSTRKKGTLMPKKQKPNPRVRPKAISQDEVQELRRQLSEAQQHRNLLIQTLHGLAAGSARSLSVSQALTASPNTLATLRSIVASYGICPRPDDSTVVGPNVTSMQQFTLDVNTRFGRRYVYGQLQSSWDISQTGVFVDNNP